MADNYTSNSRLLLSGDAFRSSIIPRNLYDLDNEYEVNGNFTLKNKSMVANTITSILGVIPQWQGIGLQNSLVSRALPNQSPLAKIGTIMYTQQLFYNSAAHLAQQNLPTINLGQLLQGKSPIIKHIDWSITDKINKTVLDKIGGVISSTFFNTNAIGNNPSPFKENTTNVEYLGNTGKAQLQRFFESINLNLYKQIIPNDYDSTYIKEFGNSVGVKVEPRTTITATKIYFNFDKRNIYPYFKYNIDPKAIDVANQNMQNSYALDANTMQEYAPTYDYVLDNFGSTTKPYPKDNYFRDFIGDTSAGDIDNVLENKLIWGRDGLTEYARAEILLRRGDDDNMSKDKPELLSGFKIRTGLLEYTRNLLNSTSGKFIDITRKYYKEGDEVIGFNGAAQWMANNSKYAQTAVEGALPNAERTGIRQHTILDPYNRFAKAIRFNGNVAYAGNPNSVIYKSVIPRIHPTKDANSNTIDNKNLMFSIENLAIGTIARDTYGVIDDEWGSPIPLSEVGPFAGRIMWFPPYDLQLNEVASAKYDSTVMVGRNEPMYNYQNSERTATLTFTLLIDYPEQLKNYLSSSNDKNKVIADFFAFGGNSLPTEPKIEEYKKQITILENSIPKITGPVEQAQPADIDVPAMSVYFMNDTPTDGQIDSIIDTLYNNTNHYEIVDGYYSAQDENGWGLNKDIYYRNGLSGNTAKTKWTLTGSSISQYNIGLEDDQLGKCLLNKHLKEVFTNLDNRKYFGIQVEGHASLLYLNKDEGIYNLALGQRRVNATIKLINARLKAIFPDIKEGDVKIIPIQSTGSEGGTSEGASPENIALKKVKEDRRATITFVRISDSVEPKVQQTNQDQDVEITKTRKDISELTLKVNQLKNLVNDNILNERNKDGDAILNGFNSISGNYYYPAFHTQTPEDFHRRLTFLQQCVRQGAAKRYDLLDEKGELRARNSVFGRQPICILRVGDFWYTKVIIDNVTIDYNETTWDMNPEGLGMQPMIAKVTLQMKVIGGQSLKGPIDALQNAVAFNYYANSTFKTDGMYARPTKVADNQDLYMHGIDGKTGIVGEKTAALDKLYPIK